MHWTFVRAEAVRSSRLPLALAEQPSRGGRRCAFLEGFSLHANTWGNCWTTSRQKQLDRSLSPRG